MVVVQRARDDRAVAIGQRERGPLGDRIGLQERQPCRVIDAGVQHVAQCAVAQPRHRDVGRVRNRSGRRNQVRDRGGERLANGGERVGVDGEVAAPLAVDGQHRRAGRLDDAHRRPAGIARDEISNCARSAVNGGSFAAVDAASTRNVWIVFSSSVSAASRIARTRSRNRWSNASPCSSQNRAVMMAANSNTGSSAARIRTSRCARIRKGPTKNGVRVD
jgi:hypothetical protein